MKAPRPRAISEGEELLALQVLAARLPEPTREYEFDDKRRWRADFAWPDLQVLAEVEGGTWSGGRHSRGGKSFEADCEKYNAAAAAGFTVLRFTTDMVKDGRAIAMLRQVLAGE